MSIALDRSIRGDSEEGGTGLMHHHHHHGMHVSIFVNKEEEEEEEEEERDGEDSCCSSSSIGKNSDDVSSEEEGENEEVQSCYKGTFDSLDALEEVLPIRRGISRFYNGKSKSFASLGEASSVSTIKEVAKPDNAYARRRRNILASSNHVWERNKNFPLKSNGGGISKRPGNLSRSTLALAVAMNSSSESIGTSEDSSSGSPPHLPPLPPQSRQSYNIVSDSSPGRSFSPWRSYSVADIQHCMSVGSTYYSSLSDKREFENLT